MLASRFVERHHDLNGVSGDVSCVSMLGSAVKPSDEFVDLFGVHVAADWLVAFFDVEWDILPALCFRVE